jgi:hypothetical protein
MHGSGSPASRRQAVSSGKSAVDRDRDMTGSSGSIKANAARRSPARNRIEIQEERFRD